MPITQSFSVAVSGTHDASLDEEVQRFQAQLSRQTGIPFRPKPGAAPTLQIHADHGRQAVQKLGEDESYELTVTDSGAKLTAPTSLGVMRGLQTFLQLVQITATGFAAPAVTIKDQPRFPWRGTLIDVSRHFIPIDVLKRNLDAMAAVKLNVLHWHLSDDQGFRVESKVFPKLTGAGSDGMFYTQEEIRDFIAYAHDRGIRVMPEFDIPGHSRSWFLGYPELSSGSGPYTLEGGGTGYIDPIMDPTRESTYKFLEKFIAEMAKLFPDAYFHIGGDEVDGKQWDANPQIQAFIHAHGMKNNQDLQAYFNQRLQKIVDEESQNHGGLGRDPASRFAEDDRGAVLARTEIAGRGRETGLQRPAFIRILSRPDVAGGAALRRRSHGGRRSDTDIQKKRTASSAASPASGRSGSRRKISTLTSGRATPRSPSACGRRRM